MQFKASFLIVVLILMVSLGGMCLSLQAMRSALLESDAQRTTQWATSLAASQAAAVAAGDREALLKAAYASIQLHKAAYVIFSDRHGRVLASAEACLGLTGKAVTAPGENGRLDLSPLRITRVNHHAPAKMTYMETAVPVVLADPLPAPAAGPRKLVGYLRCATDISDTRARLNRIVNELIRIAVGLMLLVVPCSLLATRRVVSPLKQLARAAQALAKGALDARAPVRSVDEIGELARAFNHMADRVTATHYELLELNADLECRVAQRTRELEEQAARDPLTGLYNRRHFGEVITREFAAAERYGTDLTCLMFDVDRFKEINDRYGHRTGDHVLMALADALTSEQRAADVAARFGGDEFILLLPQTAAPAASALADRIVARFAANLAESVPGVEATASIGVASLYTTRARSSEALMHEADLALYAAKEGGRNRTMQAAAAVDASSAS
ncbi:MAG: hypothetical protein AMXMBFR83_12010 [Phycisphaerae bacterium]